MNPLANPRISILANHHVRENFSWGVPVLDNYLRQQAGQDIRRNVAACCVLHEEGDTEVLGYYTLSALSLTLGQLPGVHAKKLPHYPQVPATLLGRLAVDSRLRGLGFGELLLVDALRRSFRSSREVASFAVVVDAKDDRAFRFYEHFNFAPLLDHPDRLFLPMNQIAKLFPGS